MTVITDGVGEGRGEGKLVLKKEGEIGFCVILDIIFVQK